MDALHAMAYASVQNHAKSDPDIQQRAALRARQIESCETQKLHAVPWPDEVGA